MAERTTEAPHADPKLEAAAEPLQLPLVEVPATPGERCELCEKHSPSVARRNTGAWWCDWCAAARGAA